MGGSGPRAGRAAPGHWSASRPGRDSSPGHSHTAGLKK